MEEPEHRELHDSAEVPQLESGRTRIPRHPPCAVFTLHPIILPSCPRGSTLTVGCLLEYIDTLKQFELVPGGGRVVIFAPPELLGNHWPGTSLPP